jgi:regulatory protein
MRGISTEMIADHLQITDNAWLVEARKIHKKRFRQSGAFDKKYLAKQIRFLQYRGFTQEQIEQVIDDNEAYS